MDVAWSMGQGARGISMGRGADIVGFRFQNLEIWRDSITLANRLFDLADKLEDHKLFRFAEQLRGSVMSISNNIAEGSGSGSSLQFKRYLDIARGSIFETANIVIILRHRSLVAPDAADDVLKNLESLSRKITSFKNTLRA